VKGAGLGLAVAYGIMERHGGHIAVASTPGQGTTVTLSFRTAAVDGSAAPPAPSLPPTPRCLLLIDDDRMLRMALASLLRAVGHTVVEADGGAAGLAVLARQSVDLILTDLGMPEMSGWEVAQTVKGRYPELPVVLLTGWGERVAAADDRREAVDRVLGKPVTLQVLLPLIGELTKRSES
jgi:CheY-like chemotaxis protein